MSIDNSTRHATCKMRPQPSMDETDVAVLHDHIAELRAEVARVARRRLGVRMRTETNARALLDDIAVLNEALAEAYIELVGAPNGSHATDCATNQAQAFRPGPCGCGASL